VEILCDDRNIVRKCFPPLLKNIPSPQPSPVEGEGEVFSMGNPDGKHWDQLRATMGDGQECIPSPLTGAGQERIPSPLTGEGQGGGEWRVFGTWSHGDVPVVSANDAPLRAICFIEKANENTLTPLIDLKEITRRLLACVIKPFVTADWWEKTLDLIGELAVEAPCYVMRFDKSGEIVGKIKRLIG
jgi:hypothetical protein